MTNNGVIPNITLDVGAPFSKEAEMGTLGSVFIEPSAFIQLRSFLKPDSFFLLRHSYIWQALVELDDNKIPIDQITIADQLEKRDVLDEIGGRLYLLELMNNSGTSIYAEVYGRIIERCAMKRQVMVLADNMKQDAMGETRLIEDVIDKTASALLDIGTASSTGMTSIYDIVSEHMDIVEWQMKNPHAMIGIETGFKLFDATTRGIQNKRFYLFASRPGLGKSAIMGNMALHMAQQGKRIAWFSYEMSKQSLNTRFVSQFARIDNQIIGSGTMSRDEYKRYLVAQTKLSNLPISINEEEISPMMIRALCRKMKHSGGLDCVFIDYIQLIPSGEAFGNRYQEVGYVSRMLKAMAMELDIPVVAAAQLSRGLEQRQNKRPLLADLRESGNLEQDADCVTFLYSDAYYDDNLKDDPFWEVEVIVAKQRNGPMGKSILGFNRPFTHFANMQICK
jgi:replicative DNA helicase